MALVPARGRPEARLAEARDLSARLIEVAERTRADFAEVAEGVGFTPMQARAVLRLDEPTAMGALAEHLGCDASHVTGIADRLEGMGLLERVPGADRRVRLLRLTRRGQALRTDLADWVTRGSTVTAKLDAEERQRLRELLDKLLA